MSVLPPHTPQVFVESLDRSFPNVCELDLVLSSPARSHAQSDQIFNFPECHTILSEVVSGSGLVLETDIDKIADAVSSRITHKRPGPPPRGVRTFGARRG
jgi:Clathrin adaptor complex small chain